MQELKPAMVYYTVQVKRVKQSPYNEPKGRLVKVADNWAFACFEQFYKAFDPWVGKGPAARPLRTASNADRRNVSISAGWRNGWTEKRFAKVALRSARKLDELGEWDDKVPGGPWHRAVRHAFRIVKCYYHFSWEPVE
jgi:hypothetical protein